MEQLGWVPNPGEMISHATTTVTIFGDHAHNGTRRSERFHEVVFFRKIMRCEVKKRRENINIGKFEIRDSVWGHA
jgi:hypothetical protein